jgi:hypothetical protein
MQKYGQKAPGNVGTVGTEYPQPHSNADARLFKNVQKCGYFPFLDSTQTEHCMRDPPPPRPPQLGCSSPQPNKKGIE